ncbi:MAG TPA: SpoIIE family protein phosphatase [Terriglobales bacterium]|nr:SpoIIE family protein phosphatase [Terriglobales bacterium]
MSSPTTVIGDERRTTELMLEIGEAVTSTLELDEVLSRVAQSVRRLMDYEIFAILLVNERSHDMRIRFAVGHLPEVVEGVRVKIGAGITGAAAATLEPQLIPDVSADPRYIHALAGVRSELAVPIIWKRQAIGVIDLQSKEANAFTPSHRDALVLVASRIANAIENAKLYRNAVSRERTLTLLNDISREMTSILSLDELLLRTGEMVRRIIDYHLFSILLLNERGDTLEHRVSVKQGEHIQIKQDVPLGQGIVGAAAQSRQPIIVRDVAEDARYVAVNPDVKSELAVPLVHQDKVIGVVDLEHVRKGYFNERHARTMSTLAAQMAIAIANAGLYERVARAERRMDRDLRIAQQMQRHLLPSCCPQMARLEVAARSAPARELGGDLYDFLSYTGQRWGLAVGDVAGKGAGAALYGAVVSGILRTQAARPRGPGEVLAAVNQALLQRKIEAQFVTLLFAIWHERARRMVIANSGLPYPVHVSAQGCRQIKVAGLPLGMMEGGDYVESSVRLMPGELLVFVSDGITELANRRGEEYGRIRLEAVLRHASQSSSEEVVEAIFADLEKFAEGMPPADDRTVVVVRGR